MSTNEYAIQLVARSRPPEGTVISTYHQTRGRGQYGTVWESSPDQNLALTTIVYPVKVPPRDQFLLNQAVSLAVADLLDELGLAGLAIKWPNDILLDARKTGGILIRNSLSRDRIQHSIIGIGLNVNQAEFPAHLPHATSLYRHTGRLFDLDRVRDDLCRHLESRYLLLLQRRDDQLRADYRARLFRWGKLTDFTDPAGRAWQGTVEDVTREGQLQVRRPDGFLLTFRPKEIVWDLHGAS